MCPFTSLLPMLPVSLACKAMAVEGRRGIPAACGAVASMRRVLAACGAVVLMRPRASARVARLDPCDRTLRARAQAALRGAPVHQVPHQHCVVVNDVQHALE